MRAMHGPLLAEIIADPWAIAPRLVYADALLEVGEPRGELIQVQCALEDLDADDPAHDALEARAADLLALHEPGWTWELRERCELHERASELQYRRGFIERAELRASRVPALLPILTELTPLRELRINFGTGAEELEGVPGLMDLEGLSVQCVMNGDDPMRAFASWPHRGRLRMLSLGNLTQGAAGSTVASMPALASLESLSLGTITDDDLVALAAAAHLARLRQLRLSIANLGDFGLRALGRSEAADHVARAEGIASGRSRSRRVAAPVRSPRRRVPNRLAARVLVTVAAVLADCNQEQRLPGPTEQRRSTTGHATITALRGSMAGDTLVLPMTSSTTLKVPRALKARIARLAKRTARSPHAFMLEALERQTCREEQVAAFIEEALAADRAIEEGGEVYAAADVHAWLARLARGDRAARPGPWRG